MENIAEKPSRVTYGACVVLATPRSGSTLLCDHLARTGVFGRPDEHFLTHLRAKKKQMSPEDFLQILSQGRVNNVVGVKLMSGYIRNVASLYSSLPEDANRDTVEVCKTFLEGFSATMGGAIAIKLHRQDLVAQAISRRMAMLTNQWHKSDGGLRNIYGGKDYLDRASAAKAIKPGELVSAVQKLSAENDMLDRLCSVLTIPVVEVAYEELAASPAKIGKDIHDAMELEYSPTWSEHRMKKVTSSNEVAELKRNLAEYLGEDEDASAERLVFACLGVAGTKAQRNEAIVVRKKAIAARDQAIAERDKAIVERDKAIAERDKAVAKVGSGIKTLKKFGRRSWKFLQGK